MYNAGTYVGNRGRNGLWERSTGNTSLDVVGSDSVASGAYAIAEGQQSKAFLRGSRTLASGMFNIVGDSQMIEAVLKNRTTNANATKLFLDYPTNLLQLDLGLMVQNDVMWGMDLHVVGIDDGTGSAAATGTAVHFYITATFKNVDNVFSMVGAVHLVTSDKDAAGNTWAATVAADGSNMSVQVTGQANKNILWTAHARLTQVGIVNG